jgi:hypothetical protein
MWTVYSETIDDNQRLICARPPVRNLSYFLAAATERLENLFLVCLIVLAIARIATN